MRASPLERNREGFGGGLDISDETNGCPKTSDFAAKGWKSSRSCDS